MAKQIVEGLRQLSVDVFHVGILALCLADELLQGGVLVKTQELGINLQVVHLAYAQYILYQRTRLHGIGRVHLLQGGEVARGKIEALDAVVAADSHLVVNCIVTLQLPLAAYATHHQQKQNQVYLSHDAVCKCLIIT